MNEPVKPIGGVTGGRGFLANSTGYLVLQSCFRPSANLYQSVKHKLAGLRLLEASRPKRFNHLWAVNGNFVSCGQLML
jgi:hypothetical protein